MPMSDPLDRLLLKAARLEQAAQRARQQHNSHLAQRVNRAARLLGLHACREERRARTLGITGGR
jgi:hypothetical protein